MEYWETVTLIKEMNFTPDQLIQLLATDLQQYEKDGVDFYLTSSKNDFDDSQKRARELLERVRQMKGE